MKIKRQSQEKKRWQLCIDSSKLLVFVKTKGISGFTTYNIYAKQWYTRWWGGKGQTVKTNISKQIKLKLDRTNIQQNCCTPRKRALYIPFPQNHSYFIWLNSSEENVNARTDKSIHVFEQAAMYLQAFPDIKTFPGKKFRFSMSVSFKRSWSLNKTINKMNSWSSSQINFQLFVCFIA